MDDDEGLLRSRRRMLSVRCPQWDVYTADGAEAALRQLEQRAYDVVVADLDMPQMDGLELLRIVRERYPGVVRMLCSGYARGLDDGDSVDHLLHAVLDKAASADQTIAALQRALNYSEVIREQRG